ncbi:hypothetical protein VMT40_37525 [Nocardia sp. CDC160]|nr:hypothetical protein [Nocardia sp. CDC160]MEC3920337.1 hypothetical protein [Nocardia sp. CDC160]
MADPVGPADTDRNAGSHGAQQHSWIELLSSEQRHRSNVQWRVYGGDGEASAEGAPRRFCVAQGLGGTGTQEGPDRRTQGHDGSSLQRLRDVQTCVRMMRIFVQLDSEVLPGHMTELFQGIECHIGEDFFDTEGPQPGGKTSVDDTDNRLPGSFDHRYVRGGLWRHACDENRPDDISHCQQDEDLGGLDLVSGAVQVVSDADKTVANLRQRLDQCPRAYADFIGMDTRLAGIQPIEPVLQAVIHPA